jgi:beta-glucosidase/6-phospho-beta-glucosidase/beta-galactosidase
MYYFIWTDTEVVLNLVGYSFRFGIWEIDLIKNRNDWKILFECKVKVCNLNNKKGDCGSTTV